jgi:hypothetical protein
MSVGISCAFNFKVGCTTSSSCMLQLTTDCQVLLWCVVLYNNNIFLSTMVCSEVWFLAHGRLAPVSDIAETTACGRVQMLAYAQQELGTARMWCVVRQTRHSSSLHADS